MWADDKWRKDAVAAVLLAALMTLVWAWRDWAQVSVLHLPDTDDVVRLQQIRDWLGGQAFHDLSQHRLGGGLAMHWSRLPDLVPGGLIALLTPLAGAHAAEVAAVIAWPAMLFAGALYLVGKIARAVGAPAGTSMVVAALAFPATSLFLPGRIDHHGLQIVLLLGIVLALLGEAKRARGAAAGIAAAASLVIGLETAPLIAVAGGVLLVEWWRGETRRLQGFAAGYAGAVVVAAAAFRPEAFSAGACDGFTAVALRAEIVAGVAVALLAVCPVRWRGTSLAMVGAGAAAALWSFAPACLSPYGQVDPLMARLWLGRVAEAQPLFDAPLSTALGQSGLALAGFAASGWWLYRRRTRGWAVVLAFQCGAVLLACFQLRGIHAGAMLAAPGLAATIAAARARGTVRLAGAWLGSAGILYPIAANALAPEVASGAGNGCDRGRGSGRVVDPAGRTRRGAARPGCVCTGGDATRGTGGTVSPEQCGECGGLSVAAGAGGRCAFRGGEPWGRLCRRLRRFRGRGAGARQPDRDAGARRTGRGFPQGRAQRLCGRTRLVADPPHAVRKAMQGDAQADRAGEPLHWWQTRGFVVAMALLSMVPLLWPDVPPLVDLPGHMARYRVEIDGGQHPWLNDWYDFRWSLIGNLGIDLLVIPLTHLFGLELAVKLVVLSIPPLTAVGLLWIAREVHGRIPATALFALPLAYGYPFHFGFVNYALSMALALILFALWLRLARLGRLRYRAALFVPLSCLLWLCHTFGWGVLGILAFSAEMIRQHDLRAVGTSRTGPLSAADLPTQTRGHWFESWVRAGLGCLPLALPIVLMVFWRSGDHVTGQTADWFNWRAKINWLLMALRDRWMAFDIASVALFFLILIVALRDKTIEYSRNLGLSALFLLAVYLLLPRIVFGSAYADMRLVPFLLAIALIALRPRPGVSTRNAGVVAALGLAFLLVRTGGTTVSYWLYDRSYDRTLAALDHIPEGARVVTFVGRTCRDDWTYSRLEHVSGLLTVRKHAYTNDQWSMAGAQLMTVRYVAAGRFAHDPSQIVTDVKCRGEWWKPVGYALRMLPRAAFDYVWLIQPPAYDPRLVAGMTPVWRDGTSVLFRINRATAPGRGGTG